MKRQPELEQILRLSVQPRPAALALSTASRNMRTSVVGMLVASGTVT